MYVVTYSRFAPSMSTEARALSQGLSVTRAGKGGTVRVDALHRSERPNHFAIVEAWKSPAPRKLMRGRRTRRSSARSCSASSAPPTTSACTSLCPFWRREASGTGKTAICVLTHVAVIPTFRSKAPPSVKELAEASRQDAGILPFDALTQANRAIT